MKKNFWHVSFSLLLLTTYVSCGGSMYGSSNSSSYNPPQTEQTQEGTFRGVANAVNANIVASNAAIQAKVTGDQFDIEIFGLGPTQVEHAQYLHAATRCPTASDDINKDGVIDALEGRAVYGAPVLAFDSELAQTGGTFPTGATYRYTETGSVSQILSNIGQSTLVLADKVVTMQGVPDTTVLPSTAQGAKTEFPTACGILKKI